MKVKDLISELEKLNPNSKVVFQVAEKACLFRPLKQDDIKTIRGANVAHPALQSELFDCSPEYTAKDGTEQLISLSGPTWASKRNEV